jgi:hypothetical protein
MAVPYTFATATSSIPLSQLDSNFATAITLGNTAVYLGNTTTSIGNLTLTNTTISSVAVTFPNSYLSNSSVTLGTTNVSLGGTATTLANLTLSNVTISGGTSTATQNLANVTGTLAVANGGTGLTSLTTGYIPYGNGTSVFSSNANLTYDGTNLFVGNGYLYAKQTSASNGNQQLDLRNSSNIALQGYVFGSSSSGYGAAGANETMLYSSATGLTLMSDNASGIIKFATGGSSTKMTLTSAGNVGIGTSAPTTNLHIYNPATPYLRVSDGTGYLNAGVDTGDSNVVFFNTLNSYKWLVNGGTVGMRLDSSGNLGLGVTPSTWTAYKAFQINTGGFLYGYTNEFGVGSSAYYNSGWKYTDSTNKPTWFSGANGAFYWNIGTGTPSAGGPVSFTQAMTLDNSGNLGIGTTSPSTYGKLAVVGTITTVNTGGLNSTGSLYSPSSTADVYLDLQRWSGGGSSFSGTRITGTQNGGGTNGELVFSNSNTAAVGSQIWTERMRIDSSGNLLVGTTSFSASPNCFIATPSGNTYTGHVNGTASGTAYSYFYYNNTPIGSITQSGTTAVLYNVTSDQRLKENIVDAPSGNIDDIKVRSFDWITDGTHQTYGMVAQELLEVAPYAVHQPVDTNEMMAVDYSKLVPMMIKEIQDLKQRIATLENK